MSRPGALAAALALLAAAPAMAQPGPAAVPSGTGPSGTGPSGTGPSGTGPSGTGPSGTGPSGTGIDAQRPMSPPPVYDGLQELLVEEARGAMAAGDFPRAWHFYWRLLELNPQDPEALRESGRAAHAMGRLEQAAKSLALAAKYQAKPDPELHFLRAECLKALGREAEANREFAEAERQIGPEPQDRRDVIWLGRIYAVRKQLPKAEALYQKQLARDDDKQAHTEIVMYLVEAHILADDWDGAERILREYLRYWPDYQRGKELLAWVLEARGDIESELAVRRALLSETEGRRDLMLAYARSLERANDYPGALAHYREVKQLGVADVSADIDRMRYRLSPELAASTMLFRDPSGQSLSWQAGATITVGRRWRVAALAGQQFAEPPDLIGLPSDEDETLLAATARAVYTRVTGAQLTLAASGWRSERRGTQPAGSAGFRARPLPRTQLLLSGEINQPWRESSSTIREGGVADSLMAELYAAPFGDRFVFGVTGRFRRLGLAEMTGPGAIDPGHANQLFGSFGLDVVAYVDPTTPARGEILDHDLQWPTGLATALVASLRHYELDSDNPFGARLVLVEQSRLDEVSGVGRKVFGDGVFAAEARGGIGYDWLREVRLWRAGGSLLLSVTGNTRFSFDYDVASESGTGLTGRRHAGVMGFHVDL